MLPYIAYMDPMGYIIMNTCDINHHIRGWHDSRLLPKPLETEVKNRLHDGAKKVKV